MKKRMRIVLGMVAPAVLSTAAYAVLVSQPQADMNRMNEQFAGLEELVVDSTFELTVHRASSEVTPGIESPGRVSGHVNYVATGSQWRIRTDVAAAAGITDGYITDVAWNGTDFQYFDLESGVLDITTGFEYETSGMTLVNPLYELALYALPAPTGTEDGRCVNLDAFKGLIGNFDLNDAAWEDATLDHLPCRKATVHQTVIDGQEVFFDVFARADGRILCIRRRNADGNTLTLTHFAAYDSSQGRDTAVWPYSVRCEVFNPQDGKIDVEMEFVIRSIQADADVVTSDDVTVDPAMAAIVVRDGETVQ